MSIKFENTEVLGWEAAIRGMRNPRNSWDKSDSGYCHRDFLRDCNTCVHKDNCWRDGYDIGTNDYNLMKRLANSGPVHAKYRRMITVYVDITGPLYWWKEFDTYKVGTVANSCSSMHHIHVKEFTLEDFSCDHLIGMKIYEKTSCRRDDFPEFEEKNGDWYAWTPIDILKHTIGGLNFYRQRYLETKDKEYWWQIIQLLPSSYNQRRTIMMNYEVLANIYKSRKNHKLDEWVEFCKWIESLPYSEIII